MWLLAEVQIWIKISDMKENILEFVLAKLSANKGKHKEIAEASGVPYSTLAKVSQRITPNPGVQSIQALADYFRSIA